jgi:hypothetical protein
MLVIPEKRTNYTPVHTLECAGEVRLWCWRKLWRRLALSSSRFPAGLDDPWCLCRGVEVGFEEWIGGRIRFMVAGKRVDIEA